MSATQAVVTLHRQLEAIVGPEHVRDGSALKVAGVKPLLVVTPANEEEIAAILRLASASDLVVTPCGGGTRQALGGTPRRIDVLLQTDRLNTVLQYDPGDLTIAVEAGVRVRELDETLRPHRQILPLDGAQLERASIGGMLATAAYGPLQHGFGSAREFCLGARFVTGEGTVAKAGGRVVKNVAGYDLTKLLIGSHGTLAVITSANFKVFPRPQQTRTFIADFAGPEQAVRFRDLVMVSPLSPLALELVSPVAESHLSPMIHGGCWHVIVRGSGSDAVTRRYRRELGDAVAGELSGDEEEKAWRSIADFQASVVATNPLAMTMDLSLPMSSVAAVLRGAEQIASGQRFVMASVGRATGALHLVLVPAGTRATQPGAYAELVRLLRGLLPPDGTAVVSRCPDEAKSGLDLWGRTPTDLDAMRAVKRAMDPGDVLNRGRFLL